MARRRRLVGALILVTLLTVGPFAGTAEASGGTVWHTQTVQLGGLMDTLGAQATWTGSTAHWSSVSEVCQATQQLWYCDGHTYTITGNYSTKATVTGHFYATGPDQTEDINIWMAITATGQYTWGWDCMPGTGGC